MTDNKSIALANLADYLSEFPLEFVISEDDLVTVVAQELRGADDHEFYTFHTYRIADGRIVEEFTNDAHGSTASGGGRAERGRTGTEPGEGDPAQNKARVADFYRCVFDAQNADAVKDFVTEDYRQHALHIPAGRAGLEGFVRAQFPDGPVPTPDVAAIPPAILIGEGDLVVIAAGLPQPDGNGGTYVRYLYDGFRVTDGLLAEHWSGVDPDNRPMM